VTDSPASARISPETQYHVGEMIDALETEFGETFPRDRIEQLMSDSVERLAGQANVEEFLPVLAYRFTRERLRSLSRSTVPRVGGSLDIVFVSLSGGGRSQLASALTTWLTNGAVSAHAAGTGAQQPLAGPVADVLQELGLDTSESFARPASPEVLEAADVVVTMGHSVGAVEIPDGAQHLDWRVGDPSGADVDETRRVRDDIEYRLRALLDEYRVPLRERG
jgi:protein-tyrosine-phosphatase